MSENANIYITFSVFALSQRVWCLNLDAQRIRFANDLFTLIYTNICLKGIRAG